MASALAADGKDQLAKDLQQCLMPEAQYGRYSSFDGGTSAGNLLMKCIKEFSAWENSCEALGSTKEQCMTTGLITAQIAIKNFGK
jgi:hypothetical protein